jgi:hypothetical protein
MDQPFVKPLKVKNVQNFRSKRTTAEANREICQHRYEWGACGCLSLSLMCTHTHIHGVLKMMLEDSKLKGERKMMRTYQDHS